MQFELFAINYINRVPPSALKVVQFIPDMSGISERALVFIAILEGIYENKA